jgi:hypothetical protein
MHRLLCVAAIAMTIACRGGSTSPEPPPAVQGPITFLEPDGRYRVDDGTATACGFAVVRVTDATEIRRRGGASATRAELAVGRRVAVWATHTVQRGCPTEVDALSVVIR